MWKLITGFLICTLIVGCQQRKSNQIFIEEHALENRADTAQRYKELVPREIERIVIHCTATLDGKNYTPEQAQKDWNQRGFGGVPGYNYMIGLDGTVHALRPIGCEDDYISRHEIAYGARGYNSTSIHVAYVGGVVKVNGKYIPVDTRNNDQLRSMIELVDGLRLTHENPEVVGHRDLYNVNKACPSFDAKTWYYMPH